MRSLLKFSAAVFLVLGGLAPAVSGAQSLPVEETVVEELIVTASKPAPAWWEIVSGGSTVWVLGAPMGPLPKTLRWDEAPLKAKLKGAKALILPSGGSVSLADILPLLRLRRELKEDEPLEPSLPEPLRTRFAAVRTSLGQPPQRYDGWSGFWAGRRLQQDYFDKWNLDGGRPPGAVARDAARREGVDVQQVKRRVLPVLKSAAEEMQDQEKIRVCLDAYVTSAEAPPERYRSAATAWARGDVRGAVDVPRGGDVCRELFTEAFTTNSIADQVEAISEALQSDGVSVAVVPLRQLLLKDGVLQQLSARGYEIYDPATADQEH